ncbi:MAG: PASTA domain-containing protein [Eubacterium sp.]|jgi:stage V sporulation protein D (sporulation-specific penicillin-binding protein)|uniref:penicillin-binding transpeptidase domain-containing protein n=1 Tax=Eubacterium sp. F2 TaxID=3381348 RepID=UPI00390833DA|nr:PASTA domain-containing protein [Eubacterium sp.]MCI2197994.1 PASTA domain-containing protein [Eubacterium sp.]
MRNISAENKRRLVWVFVFLAVMMLIMLFRTAWIQIVHADEYREKAISQQTSDLPVQSKRGSIYDTNGKVLASSANCYAVWARPAQLKSTYSSEKITELSRRLAVILNMKASAVKSRLTSNKSLCLVSPYVTRKTSTRIQKLKITGLETARTTKRYYPLGSSAAKLIGSVSSSNTGRSGIELEFNNELAGINGRSIKETDINGNTLAFGKNRIYGARNGYNLTLTIDEVLQHYATNAVAAGMKKTQAKKIMCIVMNPKTGDILAMVTTPSFNPNDAMEPSSASAQKKFNKMSSKQQSKYLSAMWKNPIVSDLYEPGSTFKLINTTAALEEGNATPNTKFYCSGYTRVAGTTLYCWQKAGHGSETLTSAVGNSCNPVQVQLALKLGKDKYYNYLHLFGITDKTHVDLPAETSAMIKDKNKISKVDLATMAYGQGIAVTPLQLITAISSIGNNGVLMKPRIVKKMTDSSGKTVKTFPVKKVRQVMSKKTASEMCKIMEYEVNKGSGTTVKIAGYSIGGKTGTANKAENGGYSSDTYSSFIGMAPMNNPKLAVLVVVDSPKGVHYGAQTAGPIAKAFLKKALQYKEIAPHYTSSEKKSLSSSISTIPDVTGMSSVKAEAKLEKLGLKVKESPSGSGKFTVKAQYPKAGKVVKRGTTVYIYRE